MDLTCLPINVQRRIALLLDQTPPAAPSPPASLDVGDPCGDQALEVPPGSSENNAGSHDIINARNIASELQQSRGGVVIQAAFGPDRLQAS